MLQLNNHSPFAPNIALFANEQGIDTLYIVVKATFTWQGGLQIAEQQVPPTMADEYWGDPASSSLKYASDMHLSKPGTDVVYLGRAYAPDRNPVTQLDVSLAVAEKQKTLRVFGPRQWRNGAISAAQPFASIPIVYEYAFGGQYQPDPQQPHILAIEHNPVGCGLRGERSAQQLEGLPLPNIEDPQCLIESVQDKAIPAGFAFVAPAWLPRRQYAGTYDEQWQQQRAPYLPADFDPRFFHCAHPEFIFDRYLQGGESIELDHLTPEGLIQLTVPRVKLAAKVRVAGSQATPALNLETLLIEAEQQRICMTWRAALPCDKQVLKVEKIDIHLLDLQLQHRQVA